MEGYLHSIPKDKLPFQTVHIDHYGPLEKTNGGHKYVLSTIDAFTKFIKLYACKSTGTEEVIKNLRNYFTTYSRPRRIISDRGAAFTSAAFKEFTRNEMIEHTLVAVGTPRANGQIERFHRAITPILAKLSEPSNKWDEMLTTAEFALNNTVCRATEQTPSQLLFGVNQLGTIRDEIRQIVDPYSNEDRELVKNRDRAAESIIKTQNVNENAYNKKGKAANVYDTGDYVVIRNVDVTPGINKKLLPKFKGPYEIKQALDADRYVIGDVEGYQVTQKPLSTIVSADQIKPWLDE